jgi:dihydroorotate dehydrogenase
MKKTEIIAKFDAFARQNLTLLPAKHYISLYSSGRLLFLQQLVKDIPDTEYYKSDKNKKILWNLNFGNSLFNAAGMFKNGYGYELAAAQGAGAFLTGTTTSEKRKGNLKLNIKTPFAPFPKSGAAINWMGLPNEGHAIVAKRLSQIGHKKNCPIGASLAADTGLSEKDTMDGLIDGLKMYDQAAVCFIEINESCPNTEHEPNCKINSSGLDESMISRLEQISKRYLEKRDRQLPVIVKFSNDTLKSQIEPMLDLLIDLKFDGINLGNTSTKYEDYGKFIDKSEKKIFNYFTQNFGGGLSGKFLKDNSFELAKSASDYLKTKKLSHEFNIIRTGGIENADDIKKSEEAGIALNQWFTGYFEAFSKDGHNLYHKIFR